MEGKATCVENTGENTVAFGGCRWLHRGIGRDADVPAQDKKTEIHDWSTGYFCSGKYFLCIYFSEIVVKCYAVTLRVMGPKVSVVC